MSSLVFSCVLFPSAFGLKMLILICRLSLSFLNFYPFLSLSSVSISVSQGSVARTLKSGGGSLLKELVTSFYYLIHVSLVLIDQD